MSRQASRLVCVSGNSFFFHAAHIPPLLMAGPTPMGGCLGSPCALSSGRKKITLWLVCTIQSSHISVAKLPLENECPSLSLANSPWEIPCLDLFLCHFASVKRSFATSEMVCIFGLSQKEEFMVVVVSFSPPCCLGHLSPLKCWLLPGYPLHEGLEAGCGSLPSTAIVSLFKIAIGSLALCSPPSPISWPRLRFSVPVIFLPPQSAAGHLWRGPHHTHHLYLQGPHVAIFF